MNPYIAGGIILVFTAIVHAQSVQSELFSAIGERLSYMQDVALYKSLNGLPVDDPAREAVVLEQALEDAQSAGLDPVTVEAFFQTQIALAKVIQYRYLADLQTQSLDRPPVDLHTDIRPRLITLGAVIIEGIAASLHTSGPITDAQVGTFEAELNLQYVNAQERQLLFDALKEVRLSQQENSD
ncbi:MAG: gamma subclass chorismate mutase AroQ [Pseudomonadota bacterium]